MTRSARFLTRTFLVLAVALAGATPGSATADDTLAELAPRDCSGCEERLERALDALDDAHQRNARLAARVAELEEQLDRCRHARRSCSLRLARKHELLKECRHRLERCREDGAACHEKLDRCGHALRECRDELDGCNGGPCCDPTLEPGTHGNPFCFEGATCCDDGTWRCNQADGSPSCAGDPGPVCERCCDPTQEPGTHGNPFCFEGATCCNDGQWHCNQGDGSSSCPNAGGQVCETLCCDAADAPPCIEGATCCSDGTWACNQGDGTPTCNARGDLCADDCVDPATGTVLCCRVDGVRHPVGDAFPASDGCNFCTCLPSGQVVCTLMPCTQP